jgi:peptidoglycan/xylan/chitin deacetylase (PgdA/CDA1 family)
MKGTFMLGIDVELAWGRVHRNRINIPKITRISRNVRGVLDDLFKLLEMYRIPVTWSILGHLLLDHCERGENHLPHPDMPRPKYSWLNGDWYRYDPCTNVKEHPAWYGKDLVDKIVEYVKESKLPHEIGSHSFSHQQFGDPGCEKELARAEIEKCLELMKTEYGIVPRVFTFPRAYVGHVNLLKELGFIAFADVPPKLYPCLRLEKTASNRLRTYFSLAAQFLSYYLPYPPHVVAPEQAAQGLWSFPVCLGYGRKPLIPLSLVTFKAMQGINRAMREGKIFSMYTHLRNLGENRSCMCELERILSYVDEKKQEGELDAKTMFKLVHERFGVHLNNV